jgi:hypothetical protein
MKYSGSCQCGKVRFDVDTEIAQVISCNCSRCRRLGALLAAAPKSQFTLLAGKDDLSEFQFNKHLVHHYFCASCGIQPYAEGKGRDGSDMVMVNVRCLESVDPDSFKVMKFDGANI